MVVRNWICKNCQVATDLQIAALGGVYPLDELVADLPGQPSAAAIVYPAIDGLHAQCTHRGCRCGHRGARVLAVG